MRSMLFWESIQFVFPAILLTLTAGGAAGYGFVIALKKIADYLDYRFPLIPGHSVCRRGDCGAGDNFRFHPEGAEKNLPGRKNQVYGLTEINWLYGLTLKT